MKVRSFLAFTIPDDVRKKLGRMIEDFKGREKNVKWVAPDKMHVTMKFFGSVEEELLLGNISDGIGTAVSGRGGARLVCQGIGVFPNWKYPRVIWAGFMGETEKVINLQAAVEKALSGFDLHDDQRKFRLHLTLGRTDGKLKNTLLTNFVENLGPVTFGEVHVDKLILFKSMLTKTGPIYTSLKEFSLV